MYMTDRDNQEIYFEVSSHRAFLLPPTKTSAAPTPWVWYAPTFLRTASPYPNRRHDWIFDRLRRQGVAIAGVDVGESYGSPAGREIFSELYRELTERRELSPKPGLMPQSRGGLMLYNWAAENAFRVGCIGGIYTVCDIRSYPGLENACGAYGMSADELQARLEECNPVDRLAPLARAGVPILHIHGDSDTIVPLENNSAELARRYRALGGPMELLIVPGKGHEETDEFFQSQAVVDFFLKHLRG